MEKDKRETENDINLLDWMMKKDYSELKEGAGHRTQNQTQQIPNDIRSINQVSNQTSYNAPWCSLLRGVQ